jgi:peptidoglycan lytic transglycosylase
MIARTTYGMLLSLLVSALFSCVGVNAVAETGGRGRGPAQDWSGSPRVGVASFYANRFAGRKMADGTPMDPQGDNAASRTLPLGTRARVTNLQTGQSALVTIRDRGPYVKGRIVDLSPATARLVGITPKEGLAKVDVAPIELPSAGKAADRSTTLVSRD